MVTESISIEPLPSFEGWTCPLPLRDSPNVVMGHGGGGAMSAELVEHVFLPAFGDGTLGVLGDSAVLDVAGARLAFSTDSFVVRPLFFPGGSIGDLAVNGTVNDLAMSGATPLYLSAGFILEEGVEIAQVGAVAQRLGNAAQRAGVRVVTGDTKVVESGHGDGIYINTAGIGVIPDGVDIRPDRARPGDRVIVSGDLGVHGVAIMSVREGLEFGTEIRSDCQPLNGLVAAMLRRHARPPRAARPDPRWPGDLAERDRVVLGRGHRPRRARPADPGDGRRCLLAPRSRPAPGRQRGQAGRVRGSRGGRRGAGGDACSPGRRRRRGHRGVRGRPCGDGRRHAPASGPNESSTFPSVSSSPGSAEP